MLPTAGEGLTCVQMCMWPELEVGGSGRGAYPIHQGHGVEPRLDLRKERVCRE